MGPLPRRRTRHLALILPATGLALALGMVLAAAAGADALTPDAGPTQNAIDTDTLYKIVLGIGVVVIGIVWGVLFYSLFRFRARRGRRPPQIFGNSPLELGWTIAAGVIVASIALITYIMLDGIKNPPSSGPASAGGGEGARTRRSISRRPRGVKALRSPSPASSTSGATSTRTERSRSSRWSSPRTRPWSSRSRQTTWPTAGGSRSSGPQGRRDSRATPTRPGSRPPRPAPSPASARSSAAPGHAVMSAKVTVVEPPQYRRGSPPRRS